MCLILIQLDVLRWVCMGEGVFLFSEEKEERESGKVGLRGEGGCDLDVKMNKQIHF